MKTFLTVVMLLLAFSIYAEKIAKDKPSQICTNTINKLKKSSTYKETVRNHEYLVYYFGGSKSHAVIAVKNTDSYKILVSSDDLKSFNLYTVNYSPILDEAFKSLPQEMKGKLHEDMYDLVYFEIIIVDSAGEIKAYFNTNSLEIDKKTQEMLKQIKSYLIGFWIEEIDSRLCYCNYKSIS